MTRPLSNDLRKRLVETVADGLSCRSAAERFGVAPSTAVKWVARWRSTGSYEALPQGGDKRSYRIEAYASGLLALVEHTPDMTLAEIADWLDETHGLRVASGTVWRLFDRHGVTFKKNRTRRRTAAA
jgi:transposase